MVPQLEVRRHFVSVREPQATGIDPIESAGLFDMCKSQGVRSDGVQPPLRTAKIPLCEKRITVRDGLRRQAQDKAYNYRESS
jgi:hypothetical protein